MILGKVRIQNFKSIKDTGWVHLSKTDLITILAGQNESGKTSFLRALRFFEEGAYDTFEEDDRKMGEHPRVDCTFYLTDEEYRQLVEDTNSKFAKYIKDNGFNILRGNTEKDEFQFRYSTSDEFKKLLEEINAVPEPVEGEEGSAENKDEFDPFDYFKDLRPQMVFYSNFLNNNLPGKALRPEISTNQAIKDFEKIYNINFEELMDPSSSDQKRRSEERRVRREASDSLNNYWNQVIGGERAEYNYSITVTPQNSDANQSSVNFYIHQGDDVPLNFSQKSHGFQWFAGFNLRLRAHEKELEDKGLILLIDEPGQGLHEVAQQDVKNVLEELAATSKIQIVYSTHQPILLGKEQIDFSRLLLVERTAGTGSVFKTISAMVSSQGSLDALAPIRSALGMVTITDPFQHKKTLIVEGITEYYIVKAALGTDYVIVPSSGVDQIPNIFGILLAWGVPTKTLFDDDRQGTTAFNRLKKSFFNDQDSTEFQQIALKPAGRDGIETYLSESSIADVLATFGKIYDTTKSKVENVEQVGKFIFAKSFLDQFNPENLDQETQDNFIVVKEFLEG